MLEKEFKELVNKVTPQINAELALAKEAIGRAVALSEQHGVPFQSDIYEWEWNTYFPESFDSIFEQINNLDEDFEIAPILDFSIDIYLNDPFSGWESDGWDSSSLFC